jgi:hypothetical protein
MTQVNAAHRDESIEKINLIDKGISIEKSRRDA